MEVELSELMLDWWYEASPAFKTKVRYVYYDPGFRCNCNREMRLATVQKDHIKFYYDGTTSSGSSEESIRIEDPEFFEKLQERLLNMRKGCCG